MLPVERFPIECHRREMKVITPANHKGHKQSSEPIKTHCNYGHLADAKRGKNCARASRMVLDLLLIG